MPTDPNTPAERRQSTRSYILISVAITTVITLVLTVLSMLTGGFAAYSQAQAETANNAKVSLPIAIHLATVLPSLAIGGYMLARKKGDRLHKMLGRLYAVFMLITAIASFWIGRPGTGIAGTGYSFIHAFSVLTLVSIPWAVYCARKGDIAGHEGAMRGLYIGLCVAGLFTLLPGRLLSNLVFG